MFRKSRNDCRSCSVLLVAGILAAASHISPLIADEKPLTGPQTEERFPPLQVPEGFQATLFACDPLIEYPSVIALGPETGTLFVAHDYLTGLGVEIVKRDEIRLIRDTDGDGYADRSTLYAGGFNAIQGLAWHAGAVYVMHAPLLTSLSDSDGDGVADERRDLLRGLGLPPEENSNRLHCANGVVVGHDGWLYLALGDRGCDVQRPEGDRLVFREGGILRCRPDGRDLHVFSHGLRNIYDVALDDELNVFVRDNENDGGQYMIRVCHCFHGSDHGYPYLYLERPDEAMPPLAEFGRGSSAGGSAYLETALPAEYRESLYFCEWGRAVVRYRKQRAGSGFEPMEEVDFASGADDDPYGFKPTDLVVDRDGSLLIADWCDGQRPKRGRGRIYRVTFGECNGTLEHPADVVKNSQPDELAEHLGSERYCLRVAAQRAIEAQGQSGVETVRKAIDAGTITPVGRLHAVWIVAHVLGEGAVGELLDLAERDSDMRVRAQCVRALADLTDPDLKSHRLDAGRGDERICRRLSRLGENADPRIKLDVMTALGRLRWSGAPNWLQRNWSNADPALEHAAMVLLRQSDNCPAVLELLDAAEETTSATPSLRILALRAIADRADETIVDGILKRLEREAVPERRCEYLDLLARFYKQPAAWTYWGFRPAPRPANSVEWSRTAQIAVALDNMLRDPDSGVRAFAARRMLREDVPLRDATLAGWLKRETDADAVAAILEVLARRPPETTRELLETVIRSDSRADGNRLDALKLFADRLDAASEGRLLEVAGSLEEGVVLAATLRELGERSSLDATSLFLANLDSANDDVRAAALESLATRPIDRVAPRVTGLLQDRDIRVRRAAAALAGRLKVQDAVAQLLDYADHADLPLRAASLQALTALREPAAVPFALKACDFPDTQPAALACLAALGDLQHLPNVATAAEKSRSIEILSASIRTLKAWQDRVSPGSDDWRAIERAASTIQSNCGVVLMWRVRQVAVDNSPDELIRKIGTASRLAPETWAGWQQEFAEGADAHVTLKRPKNTSPEPTYLVVSDLGADKPQDVEFLASVDGTYRVWLDGRPIFQRKTATTYQPDSDRFESALEKGTNRLLIEVTGNRPEPRFQLRFRRKSSQAEHERLTRLALEGQGNVQRGRELFLSAEKSQCIRCHRLGQQGGRIGPDLAGIGSRFSRIHLVESILDPSRTVAPSYESMVVVLESGRILTGVKVAETETRLTLGDNRGDTHELAKSEIEELHVQPRSTMPDGLEKRLTDGEFVDLISFLLSQKKTPSR